MEVLSPVKNFENAQIAIKSGADAIYFSSDVFGARSNAKNSHEEVRQIVEYAKLHYVKTYITLNTIIMNDEIDAFFSELEFIEEVGIDAVILQDFTMIETIKKHFPNLEVHCSTQMNINNVNATNFVKNLGSTRVILPRESSLEQIKTIASCDIETEVFVHGALCTSYSGQCLISSVLSKNSGNRGKCNQICRMPLELYKNGEKIFFENKDYLLSLKDLSMKENIASLASVGVDSIKIEGRLKQGTYIAATTYTYKNLVNDYKYKSDNLHKVYNREQSSGFLNDNSSKNIGNSLRVNNNGYLAGTVSAQVGDWITIKCIEPLIHQDKIRFVIEDFESGQTIDVIEKLDENTVKIKSRIDNIVGAKVYVVASFQIQQDLKYDKFNYYDKHKKLYDITVNMEVGSKIEIVYNNKSYLSSSNLEVATSKPVSKNDIIKQLSKTNDYPFNFNILVNYNEGFIRLSELNELRRAIYSDITNEILTPKVVNREKIIYSPIKKDLEEKLYYIEVTNTNQINALKNIDLNFIVVIKNHLLLNEAKTIGKKVYKILPTIIEDEYNAIYDHIDLYDGAIVSEIGGLEALKDFKKPVITNYTLNTSNYLSHQNLLKYNVEKTMLSLELDYLALKDFTLENTILFLYGHIPVMTLKYCPINSSKVHKCNSCTQCKDNEYELVLDDKRYKCNHTDFDKLELLSHQPIFNKSVQEFNSAYYLRFTNEENIDELIQDILNSNITNYSDNYELLTK